MENSRKLVYVHDPMCSWCWGFSATYRRLVEALPGSVTVERLLGGLAPDSDEPMPGEMQAYLQQTWHAIEERVPGTRFNHDYWRLCQPRRSTYPACRAVIAARLQGAEHDETMTAAIQRAYYLEARNPSDDTTLIELSGSLGLDREKFSRDLNSASTVARLEQEVATSRQMGVMGFPSLCVLDGQSLRPVRVDYNDIDTMLAVI